MIAAREIAIGALELRIVGSPANAQNIVVVALVFGIPIVLVPGVFVWYLNVSGLYQVLRDRRRRRKVAEPARETVKGIS